MFTIQGLFALLFAVTVALIGASVFMRQTPASTEASEVIQPSDQEKKLRRRLGRKFPGKLLFDSNRSGTFGVYTIDADGKNLTTIVDGPKHEVFPEPSPDGKLIVYALAETPDRESPADVWICNRDGSGQRLVAKNGTFPSFSPDGKTVYFERTRNKLMAVDLDGSNERELFPANRRSFRGKKVVKPRISSDGKYVAFTSDRKGRWNAWVAGIEVEDEYRVGKGCEPAWFSNREKLAWIKRHGAKAGSGVFGFNVAERKQFELNDDGPPRGHEYFPTVAGDDKFLLFSSAMSHEHSHETSNYQLYIRELPSAQAVRITFDEFTNRWPKLLPEATS